MNDDPPPTLNYASRGARPPREPILNSDFGCLGAAIGFGVMVASGVAVFGALGLLLDVAGPPDPRMIRHAHIAGMIYLAAIILPLVWGIAIFRRKRNWNWTRAFLAGALIGVGAAMLIEGICFSAGG